jgi:hypothetical protein
MSVVALHHRRDVDPERLQRWQLIGRHLTAAMDRVARLIGADECIGLAAEYLAHNELGLAAEELRCIAEFHRLSDDPEIMGHIEAADILMQEPLQDTEMDAERLPRT